MKIYYSDQPFKPRGLTSCGQAIWGPQWKKQAEIFLGVTRTTLNRWCNGSVPIPLAVSQAMRLRHKMKQLAEAK